MSDLDKQLFEIYGKKKGNAEDFISLIENLLGDLPLIQEEQESARGVEQEVRIPIPKLRITEAWGVPGSKDRQIIERYSRNIPGDTLPEKLQFLTGVVSGELQLTNVREVLSTLVILEVLSTILDDFTESAGGFIFEGFLAGLMGLDAEQITGSEEKDVAGKPITDVVLGGVEYSLKLLGQTTGVKGSFKNMVEHFKSRDHIVYLDARRKRGEGGSTEALEFGEFRITLENFLDVFVKPLLKQVTIKDPEKFAEDDMESASKLQQKLKQLVDAGMAIKLIKTANPQTLKKRGLSGIVPSQPSAHIFTFSDKKGQELNEAQLRLAPSSMSKFVSSLINMDTDTLQKYGPFEIKYTEEKFEQTKASVIFGSYAIVQQLERAINVFKDTGNSEPVFASLMKTPGYTEKQQFEFTRDQAESIRGFQTIAELSLGEETLKASWERYATLLESTIAPIYQALENFSDNLSLYMTGGDEDRKTYMLKASADVDKLKTATENAAIDIDK